MRLLWHKAEPANTTSVQAACPGPVSLTTIDLGNGQVTGISYNSIAPIEQRLGALRVPLGQTASRIELLAALRGARLEVTSASGVVTGRLLSVERTTRSRGEDIIPTDDLSVVTDGGDVRSFELTAAVHVRILDRELRQDVSRYLDVVGSNREQDVRQMVISTAGTGERPLFVSYVSEVPIWKTTYRLVLRDQGAKPLLQGWAIVDNTIGEDWQGVELSLASMNRRTGWRRYGRISPPPRAVAMPRAGS